MDSGCFDEIMVSTDSDEIAEISRSYGAKTPFSRSSGNANDHAGVAAVIREVLLSYANLGVTFDLACCIYATAALIRPARLRQAAQIMATRPEIEGVITVVRTPQPAGRALVIRDGTIVFQNEDAQFRRSQDMEETFFDAAQMYWLRSTPFLDRESDTMAFLKRYPLVLSEFETQDINTLDDWLLAELKHRFLETFPNILLPAQSES